MKWRFVARTARYKFVCLFALLVECLEKILLPALLIEDLKIVCSLLLDAGAGGGTAVRGCEVVNVIDGSASLY